MFPQIFRGRDADEAAPWPAGNINKPMIGGAVVDLSDRLQAPSLGLSDVEWSNSVLTLMKSPELMRALSPGVPVTIVYIPSPLSSYDLVSDEVSYQVYGDVPEGTTGRTAAARVGERSARLRRAVCEVAAIGGISI